MDLLVDWVSTCGLRFNPDKTVAIAFSRSREIFTEYISIDGKPIMYSDSVRYLRIFLDRRLFWRTHLDTKITKAKKFLMQVSSITQKTWGPKLKLMNWVWENIVRAALIYGSLAWGHVVQMPFFRDKLRSINRLGMSTYTSFPKSSPVRAIERLTDTFPLHLYILKEGLCAFIRLHADLHLDWSGKGRTKSFSTSHRKFWHDLIDSLQVNHLLLEVDHTWGGMPPKGYQVDINSFALGQPDWFAQYTVYTDGSK